MGPAISAFPGTVITEVVSGIPSAVAGGMMIPVIPEPMMMAISLIGYYTIKYSIKKIKAHKNAKAKIKVNHSL